MDNSRKLNFFTDHNLAVIPVLPKSKKTSVQSWPDRRPADNDPGEYNHDSNIGVVLGRASGNLVDIDLDCPMAIKLADHFLPPTGWKFGRQSARKSHRLYRVTDEPGKTKRISLGGSSFAEYRGDGAYTVFPPSVHEGTGEPIEFESCGALGSSTRRELVDCITLMATCATVLPVYRPGNRHQIALSLSGALFSLGRTEDQVVGVINGLCSATNDEEHSKRLEAVRDTARRHRSGQSLTQLRQLNELIGDEAVNQLTALLKPYAANENTAEIISGLLPRDDWNDAGVARLFAEISKREVLYDKASKCFFTYSDGLWSADTNGIEVGLRFDNFILQQVSDLRINAQVTHEQARELLNFFLKYRNNKNARNAIEQARLFLVVDEAKLGEKDDHLGVSNGLLNLRSGSLEEFNPEQYVLKRTSVKYDPDAQCPIFKRVLGDAFDNDEELISYFQAISGYWLTGNTDRQELYILHGTGANGKSTILNAISEVLGPHAGSLMSETIFEGMNGQHYTDLASVQRHRLAIVHEAESKFRLNAARIKQLTGQDAVKVKELYNNPHSIRPKMKLAVVCNKRPNIDAYDKALQRRIKLIPFDVVIPSANRDPKLGEKLKAEASGILNFLIEGARMYFNGRIREPKAVLAATGTYIRDQDSVSNFLQDRTGKSPGSSIGKGELYDAYLEYCNEETMEHVTKGQFGALLKENGFSDTRTGQERKWRGLDLKPEDSPFSGLVTQ